LNCWLFSSYNQKGHDAIEGMFAFVPARTANRQQLQVERQQLQADLNAQKTILSQHAREIEKKAQELASKGFLNYFRSKI
jgi:hypothetical protein